MEDRMEGESESARDDVGLGRSIGPIVMLLPLAFLVLGISYFKDRGGARLGPRATPPTVASEETVSAWGCEFVGLGRIRWRAILAPLHANPIRQGFDARVLARRLELGEGQPYKLEVECLEPQKLLDLELPGHPIRPAKVRDALTSLDKAYWNPREVFVEDSVSRVLVPVVQDSADLQGLAALDPLRTLLEEPKEYFYIPEDATIVWFLWGAPPFGPLILEGFSEGKLTLNPLEIPRSSLEVALLRPRSPKAPMMNMLPLLLLSVLGPLTGFVSEGPVRLQQDPEAKIAAEREAHAATRTELRRLQARVNELEKALAHCEEERLRREKEWLGYTRAIAGLSRPTVPENVSFESVLAKEEESIEQHKTAERIAAESRGHEVFLALRSLFVAEGIDGYDLLESGLVQDGATGPVVVRLLDQMRRPVGSLSARRLRLEGSQSGHTLTLVFEEGYERRSGMKIPFGGGTLADLSGSVRRIVLPSVNPKPWMESMPELFEKKKLELPTDDGKWDLVKVKRRLNELLREDAAGSYYRLNTYAGVTEKALRVVHLEERDPEGRIERRFFADSMRFEALESGIRITLESGAQIRGTEKLPFLGDRFQIFLPGARLDGWCDGVLPGLLKPE